MGYRLSVDTGGTFTDIGLVDENSGQMAITKVPSTPDNPSRAVINGVKKIMKEENIKPEDINFFLHGTTVATNALLELKGAKTALITTEGFRDVLHIGRQTRPSLYDFYVRKPEPIVPRNLRYEVKERVLYTGEVQQEIDETQVREICKELKNKKVIAVAVCLVNSYANPAHEQKIKEILLQEYPELFITVSSEILPEFREYERMSTACINAYVMPKVNSYVADLANKLSELKVNSGLYIMQSNGGVITAETARESSGRTVLSGPAGGALAGTCICQQTKHKNIITADMGGTSLDICLIENNKPKYSTQSSIGGYPIKLPMIDINTIGAGGGSIAWIDAGGALRVGPQSAGAVPGPVCYCKGGTEPTITDANVILGRLNPKFLLSGEFQLDVDKARKAIEEKIAKPLNLSVIEAAKGIIRVANSNMVRGIRVVSVEKGHDPREFALVPFGGAGPVHGVELAEELGMSEVIVPANPGVNSAIGMLTADVRHDYVQTHVVSTNEVTPEKLSELFDGLVKQARKDLAEEGFAEDKMEMNFSADMRYAGQSFEISIPVDNEMITVDSIKTIENRFHDEHFMAYGYKRIKEVVEIVNVRLTALGILPKVGMGEDVEHVDAHVDPIAYRDVYMRDDFVKTAIYKREDFVAGTVIQGPAIVEQLDSTSLIFPGQTAKIDNYGNMLISLKGGN